MASIAHMSIETRNTYGIETRNTYGIETRNTYGNTIQLLECILSARDLLPPCIFGGADNVCLQKRGENMRT